MARKLIQIKQSRYMGFGCSDCEWRFNAARVPPAKSFAELVRNFEEQRDEDFAHHTCGMYPKSPRSSK